MVKNKPREMGNADSFSGLLFGVHRLSSFGFQSETNSASNRFIPERNSVKGSSGTVSQESHSQDSPSVSSGVLEHVFPGAQENGRLETNSQSETTKSVYQTSQIQDGVSFYSNEDRPQRVLGHQSRSQGCVPTHSNSPKLPQMAEIYGGGPGFSVYSPSIRPFDISQSFYKNCESSRSFSEEVRNQNIYVSRRLAHRRPFRGQGQVKYKFCHGRSFKSGFRNQLKKVAHGTVSISTFPGSATRFKTRHSKTIAGKSGQSSKLCPSSEQNEIGPSSHLVKNSRSDGEHGRYCTILQTAHASDTDSPVIPLRSTFRQYKQIGTDERYCKDRTQLVVSPNKSFSRCRVSGKSLRCNHDNRCITNGMGRTYSGSVSKRNLVEFGSLSTHKFVGTMGCTSNDASSSKCCNKQKRFGSIRQQHSGGLYKQTGGDSIPNSLSAHKTVNDMVYRQGNSIKSCAHSRGVQHTCGRFIKGKSRVSDRMDSEPAGFSINSGSETFSNNRSLCVQSESPTSNLLFQTKGRQSMGNQRSVHFMESNDGICISANSNDTPHITQNSDRRLPNAPDSSVLAKTILVSGSSRSYGRLPNNSSSRSKSSSKTGNVSNQSRSKSVESDSMVLIKRRYQEEGFSEQVADLIAKGRRESTLRIYSSRIRSYIKWCRNQKISPLTAPVTKIAEFLKWKFDAGIQTSTVRGYLSAIQAIYMGGSDGSQIKDNQSLKLLLVGMFNARPMVRKIWPSWDLSIVLEKLQKQPFEPLSAASLRDLTIKTLFLIAISSGRRCSELHALAIGNNMIFSESGVTLYFKPAFLAKNESQDFTASPLFIPYFNKNSKRSLRLNCPVRAISWYLQRTQTIRDKCQQLFITTKKPFRPAAKSTLAGWLVDVIMRTEALDDIGTPKAHSVRAFSSSWAFAKGLSIQDLINTVSWKTSSTFISTYMKDVGPITSSHRYANKVLRIGQSRGNYSA